MSQPTKASRKSFQALELGADLAGTNSAAPVAMSYFSKMLSLDDIDAIPAADLKGELALVTSLGPFLAMTLFRPEARKKALIDAKSHPDSRFRALWMVSNLINLLGAELKIEAGSPELIEQISSALSIVLMQNAAANDSLVKVLKIAPRDGDVAVLRTSGIRKLLFSDELRTYHRNMFATYGILKSQLQPYARGQNSMPMQTDSID